MKANRPSRSSRRRAIGAAVVAVALLAACGSDDDSTAETTTTNAPASEIEISGVWARTSPAVATAGAVYLDITNLGDLGDS